MKTVIFHLPSVLCLLSSVILVGCASQRGVAGRPGLPNFDQVSPTLYRGGQPSALGIGTLHGLHVGTVINLRDDEVPFEPAACERHHIRYVPLPLPGSGVLAPNATQLSAAVAAVAALPGTRMVHCQFGCERTGAVIAGWRVVFDHWSTGEALAEARAYGMSESYCLQLSPALNRLERNAETLKR